MAVRGYVITISANGAQPAIVGKADPIALATTSLTDLTSALAVTAIAGDGPSTTAVTLVQTDVTALKAAINGNIVVLIDTAAVTTRNQLNVALEAFRKAVLGSNALS